MRIGWREGRGTAVAVAASALLLSGCGLTRGCWKVARTLSPVALVRSDHTSTPVERYDAARKLFLRGQYRRASGALEQWLSDYRTNPLEPAALYYLGRSYYHGRRVEQAAATYERLAKAYPNTDWGRFAREDLVAVKAGRPAVPEGHTRLRWWHPADWFTPDPPTVREFKAARGHFDHRRYDEALAAFRTLAERHPDNALAPAAWHYVARCHERLGQLGKARETLAMVSDKHRDSHWATLARADLRRLKPD